MTSPAWNRFAQCDFQGLPCPAAAVQFAGVCGQANFVGAFVAFDELDRQIEAAAMIRATSLVLLPGLKPPSLIGDLRRKPLIHIGNAAFLAQGAHRAVLNRHAEEFQLSHVEVDAFHAESAAQDQRAVEDAERKAVGLGAAVKIFGGDQRARAGHVFNKMAGLPGICFAHVACHGARVNIEAAAGAAADDDADRFPFVEIIGARRVVRSRR